MSKSVYSLMIFDEIVEQIDQRASKNNQNRSQVINEILADHLGLITPEQKIQKILTYLSENLSDTLNVNGLNKNSSIHFDKNLDYKYHPKVQFTYEFTGTGDDKFAVLKISSRTKNDKLNKLFNQFFNKIVELEHRNCFYLGTNPKNESKHKFVREFRIEGSVSKNINEVAKFLLDYLMMVDEAMNLFFNDQSENLDRNLQKLFDKFFVSTQLQIKTDNPLDLVRLKN